jgi:hypothetical protein
MIIFSLRRLFNSAIAAQSLFGSRSRAPPGEAIN